MALCPVGRMIDDPMNALCQEFGVAFGMGGADKYASVKMCKDPVFSISTSITWR